MTDLVFLKGIKRSGNHLFINWILSHFTNPIFRNDINPFEYLNIKQIKNNIKHIKLQPRNDCLFISMEMPHLINEEETEEVIQYILNNFKINKIYKPFIIRDPVNWYTSTIAKAIKTNSKEFSTETFKQFSNNLNIKLWDMYKITIDKWEKSDFKVDYNKFIQSIDCRINLSKKINKIFNIDKDKKALNTLWEPKGVNMASSFNKDEVKKGLMEAKDMKVLERYKEFDNILDIINIPKSICQFSLRNWPEIPVYKNITVKMI